MEGGARSKRAARPASKAATAIARLVELKRNGGKRGEDDVCKVEEAVYDIVEEDEYAKIMARRRDEGGVCTSCKQHASPGRMSYVNLDTMYENLL